MRAVPPSVRPPRLRSAVHPFAARLAALLATAAPFAACHAAGEDPASVQAAPPQEAAPLSTDGPSEAAQDARPLDARGDAHDEIVTAARAALDAGTWDGQLIGAASMHTSVIDRRQWPPDPDAGAGASAATTRAVRLGYLRYGAKVAAFSEPLANEACPEGWYELVEGGYVCGKYATFDLKDPRVRLAPAPPRLDAPMPYKYGYSLGQGTPVYRRVLSPDDRKKYEPWLAAPPAAAAAPKTDKPEKADDGASGDDGEAPNAGSSLASSATLVAAAAAATAASVPDASIPWFMREHDGGRPPVTLDDLHGRGVLVRRMMRGFYLALDREFKAAHARWWRTTAGFAVPFERVGLQSPPSDFHGSWITYDAASDDAGAPAPTGAALLLNSGYAAKYTIDVEKKKITRATPAPKMTAVALSGEPLTISGTVYHPTTAGEWVRLADGIFVAAPEPPANIPPDGKWIDVDTTRQLLVAYEGTRPVFMTLVSSGKKNTADPEKNWTTPPGVYRIREKHVTATMDGDVAADGPYSIEDVPWVMYFQGSYALHAAFWHSAFGHPRSHGCVNMSPVDARDLFFWAGPRLPSGWHGVYANDGNPGAVVVVHEEAKKTTK
jgi:lipoprotein-anchoring transpeptidase ErfK/SrfK